MKMVISVVLALCMVLSLGACGTSASSLDKVFMKYSVSFPGNGVQAQGAEKLKELIEQYSDGRIEVEIYYSSQLGGNTEAMEGLRFETIEMTELSLTALSAYSDIWSTFSLPYMWDSGREAIDVISSDKVMSVLEPDVEENGMMILTWQNLGSRNILNTKRAVNGPDDLKGLRVRVIEDPILVDSINAMGGSAVAMAWSECYSGLEQGTIDGLENSSPVIVANAMYEVGKYYSMTEQFIIPDPVLISKEWFEGLSKENQEAIMKAGEEYTRVWNDEIWPEAEGEAIDTLKENGVSVNEVDKEAFVKATESVRSSFVENGSEGQKNLYNVLVEARG